MVCPLLCQEISYPAMAFPLMVFIHSVNSLASPYIHTSQHGAVPAYVPRDLQQAKFVFVSCDTHCTPLQYSYISPYKAIQPGFKTFKINRGGKPDIVSVDRIKPAHMDLEHSSILHPVPRPQRRLRQIPQAIPACRYPTITQPKSSHFDTLGSHPLRALY